MSENLRRYTTVVFGFEHTLAGVPSDAWERPSPCDGWTVRQCAGHAMGVVNNVAARAGVGSSVDPFNDLEAIAGDDPLATMRGIRRRLLEATDQRGALQRSVSSSAGEMPLDRFIGMMCADTLVHTWDIARGAGLDVHLDDEAVVAVLGELEARDPEALRAPGRYGAAVTLDPSSSLQDRLIAFTGRQP